MSQSSLWAIDEKFHGECEEEYANSWLFSPMVWQILEKKYIPDLVQMDGYRKSIITNPELIKVLNAKVNVCKDTPDRICWELSHQQVFFTKDKKCVAQSIRQFVMNNKESCADKKDHIPLMKREHIANRFNEIAGGIEALDENKYPYFVFKNTDVDDTVEIWFERCNEDTGEYEKKSLSKQDAGVEFVIIEDGKISGFKNFEQIQPD